MSKKLNKSGISNTLLNYFAKSPASVEKKKIPSATNGISEIKNDLEKENMDNGKNIQATSEKPTKRCLEADLQELENIDEDDDITLQKGKKRRRVVLSDSDEEDSGANSNTNSAGNDDSNSDSGESDNEIIKIKDEPKHKKVKVDQSNELSVLQKLQSLQEDAQNNKSSAKNNIKAEQNDCNSLAYDEPVVWPHHKLDFLKPDKIKDRNGKTADHPDYDPTTLFVPTKFLDSLTPGVRQWWILKSNNFDCVLFFKVGKFYELYHMDADVGVKELGFTYMRGEFAHSGFPEISYDKMVSVLVDRGYKVARVEQTETPDMMTERCKHMSRPTKFDKVVRREICQITNRGTQVFGSQCQITPKYQPNYLLALVEKDNGVTSTYGVCYIDTSIGDFYIGEFEDDKNCSRLLTLLSHYMPVLVLFEKSTLSERTRHILRTSLAGILKEPISSAEAMKCDAENTLKHLAETYYATSSENNWPLVLRTMQDENDHLGLTPKKGYILALKALGECIRYMKKCYLEEKILPMARYNFYEPPDKLSSNVTVKSTISKTSLPRSTMVLDATTLSNLRITGEEHSLYATLDNCCTKFGKRLLHYWLCAPSCDLNVIVERQNAITDLMDHPELLQELRALLTPMPDFERHLAQVHLFGNKTIMQKHPDGRAILFEEKLYNKKKIQNFISILKGFEILTTIPDMLKDCSSVLIKRITQTSDNGGIFPKMHELLQFFNNAFNHEEAAKTGVVAPEKGVDSDYDECEDKIKDINQSLQDYLKEQEKFFGCRLAYFGTDKKRFQLEVPESNARKAGKVYQLEGQKKGNKPCRRFSTNETRAFLKQMQNAEVERDNILKDLARRIFEKFSNNYSVWKLCTECISNLDVLSSLAEYARQQNVLCIPEFIQPDDNNCQPFVDIEEGYHPCVSSDTYIPNGIVLGSANVAPLSILTGPNMGGKSTLMRQVGLLAVMAQIGSHVPAQKYRLSLVDRIFTRLGAQDDMLSGQSTFLVELNETSLILKHATVHSLVLLDELGRGTATYDGTAIAVSVVNYLADIKCRTLFSTHYHNLIDFFQKDQRITLGHMACMVENEDNDDPTQETVTFLYKYSPGACPTSYGFNAAKLAGMPTPIIRRAYQLSKKVEAIALKRKITAKILASAGGGLSAVTDIQNLLRQFKKCNV